MGLVEKQEKWKNWKKLDFSFFFLKCRILHLFVVSCVFLSLLRSSHCRGVFPLGYYTSVYSVLKKSDSCITSSFSTSKSSNQTPGGYDTKEEVVVNHRFTLDWLIYFLHGHGEREPKDIFYFYILINITQKCKNALFIWVWNTEMFKN